MSIQDQAKGILDKQMNRQNFIKHSIVGTVAPVNGGTLIRMGLSHNGPNQSLQQSSEQLARRAA